jgi:hypothetical protein
MRFTQRNRAEVQPPNVNLPEARLTQDAELEPTLKTDVPAQSVIHPYATVCQTASDIKVPEIKRPKGPIFGFLMSSLKRRAANGHVDSLKKNQAASSEAITPKICKNRMSKSTTHQP